MSSSFKHLSKREIAKHLAMSLVLMSIFALPARTAVEDQAQAPGEEIIISEEIISSEETPTESTAVETEVAGNTGETDEVQMKNPAAKIPSSVSALVTPGPGGTQTLEQVLTAAYEYNSEIKSTRAAVRAADEAIAKAKAAYRPTLNLTGQAQTATTINSGTTKNFGGVPSSSDAKNVQGGVQANQNIFQGWNTEASVAEAESTRESALLDLITLEQRVFTDTVTSYFTLLGLAAEARLLKASVDFSQEQLNSSDVKFKVGEETRTSVAQAQAQLSNYTAQLSSKEAQVDSQKATFTRLTGLTSGALSKPKEFTTIPAVLTEAIEIAMSENPDIRSKKYLADAAEYAKTRVSSGLWPKLDLQAGSTYTKTDTKSRDVINPSIGGTLILPHTINNQVSSNVALNLTVPLYEGGAVRADRRHASEISEQRRVEIETTRRRVMELLAQQWTTFKSARANLEFYRQQVAANEISLEGTKQEMAVGTKILLDVLDEQSKLTQAQQNLVNAERDYYIAGFQIIASMGRLTSNYLNLPVQKYDADAHYQETVDRW